jgi:hypothetical protein
MAPISPYLIRRAERRARSEAAFGWVLGIGLLLCWLFPNLPRWALEAATQ